MPCKVGGKRVDNQPAASEPTIRLRHFDEWNRTFLNSGLKEMYADEMFMDRIALRWGDEPSFFLMMKWTDKRTWCKRMQAVSRPDVKESKEFWHSEVWDPHHVYKQWGASEGKSRHACIGPTRRVRVVCKLQDAASVSVFWDFCGMPMEQGIRRIGKRDEVTSRYLLKELDTLVSPLENVKSIRDHNNVVRKN